MSTTFFAPTSLSGLSIVKNAGERSRIDLTRHFRSELATPSEANESVLSGHPPLKSTIGLSQPEISGAVLGKLSSPQENKLVVPTLRYTYNLKAASVPSIPEQSGINSEQITNDPITYPPALLPVDPPAAQITESQAKVFRRKSRIDFASLCLCVFLAGWNDGSPGPLLPALQQAYQVITASS
jgi:hypothetical protein